MKKKILISGFLLLTIALLIIGLTGCGTIVPCTTGTLSININDNYTYWVYIDGNYWGTTDSYGDITLYNVPLGYHTIYVQSTDYWCEGTVYPTINCGVNYVSITVFCIL